MKKLLGGSIAAAALALASCGGGGGGSANASRPAAITVAGGVLVPAGQVAFERHRDPLTLLAQALLGEAHAALTGRCRCPTARSPTARA